MKLLVANVALILGMSVSTFSADVPQQLNYQARIEAQGVPFDGVGKFKFAIVDQSGSNTYWSNDGTSSAGSEPTASVSLNVAGGVLNEMLGNASYPNMTVIPPAVFSNPDRQLRVWFGGSSGSSFERLLPDGTLGSVPFAHMAATVPDASIYGEKLARESVWPVHEGRNNTIVSYFAVYNLSMTNMGTIATNKNFIITDVVFGPAATGYTSSDLQIRYTKNSVDTILFQQKAENYGTGFWSPPNVITFRSGLVVPAGATLSVSGFLPEITYQRSCSISGFEIPVGGP